MLCSRTPGTTTGWQIPARSVDLAGQPAIKIGVNGAGWHRVTQPELLSAGLSKLADPRLLQLYVDDKQVPIRVTGEEDGSFDAGDTIEFYGVALDTPSTDKRVYWLRATRASGDAGASSELCGRCAGRADFHLDG